MGTNFLPAPAGQPEALFKYPLAGFPDTQIPYSFTLPGYKINEYLLILSPHKELRNKIKAVKDEFYSAVQAPNARRGAPHITLVKFLQYALIEERISNRLKMVAMGYPPFRAELKNFGGFPSHSIYINVTTREPIRNLVKEIRPFQQLMKLNNDTRPHFADEPHLTISRKLQPWQYEKGWLEYRRKHFSGTFIADSMLLLKRQAGQHLPYQILQRLPFMNLPVNTKQGGLFGQNNRRPDKISGPGVGLYSMPPGRDQKKNIYMSDKLQQDHFKVSVKQKDENGQYHAGRGAQINTRNRFLKTETTREHIEGIDDWEESKPATQYLEQESKTIVNKVDSPDVGMSYSMNPYAGCEHGCIYCYARNVHEYWGYSAGLDFEQKIIVKKNAPQLLRKFLMHPKWDCHPIMLSGNTDCYQPAEQQYRLTRGLLEVCNEFNQPVGILTKNSWILKDKDVLQEMAKKQLVSAMVSITSFNEDLRRIMEPRTTTAKQKLKVIEELSHAGVRMGVMMGPMIPGLNEHEMQRIMKAARDNGATFTAYTFIRLNGAIKLLFHDWLYKNFPDRADKVWHLIEQSHDGKVNDTRWGVRMRGEGSIAQMVAQQYKKYGKLYGMNAEDWSLNTSIFKRPGEQGKLF